MCSESGLFANEKHRAPVWVFAYSPLSSPRLGRLTLSVTLLALNLSPEKCHFLGIKASLDSETIKVDSWFKKKKGLELELGSQVIPGYLSALCLPDLKVSATMPSMVTY